MKRHVLLFFLLLFTSIGVRSLAPVSSTTAATVAVLTQHNDNQRTGANLNETILNTSNVKPGTFGKLFTREVDGHIYAQPLYVPGVTIPNKGIHNVVYVATQHNSVYAFDADNPLISAPLWHVNLGQSAPVPADFGNRYGPFEDIAVEVGITSTPVIDLGTNTLYVVAFIRDTDPATTCSSISPPCVYHHSLHALDITSGAEKFGGPVQIAGSVPGTGADSVNGVVTFNSHQQIQRSSLLLSNGVVYVAFAGYADTDPYHGWIFGYNVATLARVSIFNTTPNAVWTEADPNPGEGGIWQSGQGLSADQSGYIYLITGNGSFSANTGGVDYGNTFLKLNPQNLQNGILSVADWFTPYNQQLLSQTDLDVGSTGVLLIPGTNYLVGGGKEGILYQIDKTDMGHYNGPGGPDQVVQRFPIQPPTKLFNSPILWDRLSGRLVYVWGMSGPLEALGFIGNLLQQTPVATGSTSLSQAFPGGAISLSANGSDTSTGIVWASHPAPSSQPSTNKPGVLRAYDAADISNELWNSEIVPNDSVGIHTKYNAPTIANGKVYLGTSSDRLVVYGLILKNSTFLPLINTN
jgi:hypothetical protein